MVEIYDDRVSIVSPGGVPKGITKENFGKVSRQAVATNIKELKDNNVIERVGANKKYY